MRALRFGLLVLAAAFLLGYWSVRHGSQAAHLRDAVLGPPFQTTPASRARTGPVARLAAVRTSLASGYDRVEFSFGAALPGWRVRYVATVPGGGSGSALRLDGGAFLLVDFDPAGAHDDRGALTIASQTITTGAAYPALRQVRLAGDFEGHLTFGVGVRARGGFRVVEQPDQHRIAIDVLR